MHDTLTDESEPSQEGWFSDLEWGIECIETYSCAWKEDDVLILVPLGT